MFYFVWLKVKTQVDTFYDPESFLGFFGEVCSSKILKVSIRLASKLEKVFLNSSSSVILAGLFVCFGLSIVAPSL
jgi:hypothetical protein